MKKSRFYHILLFCVPFILTSCVSTQQFTAFTKEKIVHSTPKYQASDYINVSTDSLVISDSLVKVQKIKSYVIPAILYWRVENTLKCEISPIYPVKIFEKEFIRLADSLDLRSKLNGRKIELSITQIPNQFVYTFRENVLIYIVGYTMVGTEAIYPNYKNLNVNYKITENGILKKEGSFSINGIDPPMKNVWKSTKKFTWIYLDQYNRSCRIMGKTIFEKLLVEIF